MIPGLTADSGQLTEPGRVIWRFLLAVVLILGSLFLWIGIPLLGFWVAGQVTSTSGFLFAVLGGVPLVMVGFGWALHRVNLVYERLGGRGGRGQGRSPWLGSLSGERTSHRRAKEPRGLLDVAMTLSAIVAITLLLVWFFFFAHQFLAPMQ